MNRKIENCFLWYASTIPALLFRILSAKLNQNVIFMDYLSLISAWKWVWISSYCFWVLSEFWAKGRTVAATYWQLFRCIKPFCLSSDTLPVFSVDHRVLEYLDGYCQPMEERWTSSPRRKGRNVASNELSIFSSDHLFLVLHFQSTFVSSVIILPFSILRWYEQKYINIYNLQEI